MLISPSVLFMRPPITIIGKLAFFSLKIESAVGDDFGPSGNPFLI